MGFEVSHDRRSDHWNDQSNLDVKEMTQARSGWMKDGRCVVVMIELNLRGGEGRGKGWMRDMGMG